MTYAKESHRSFYFEIPSAKYDVADIFIKLFENLSINYKELDQKEGIDRDGVMDFAGIISSKIPEDIKAHKLNDPDYRAKLGLL